MRVTAVLAALALALPSACTHADAKGRETLRLAPLRDARVRAADVDSVVRVDAGTDALTDDELAAVERALPRALEASFAALGGAPVGMARVGACKLRAGPTERFVLYVAKCQVSLVVDGVAVVEATTEAIRRTQNIFKQERAPRPPGVERDPAVDASQAKAVLVDALDAAARIIVDGPLPVREGEQPPLPRAQRAELAREALARADSTPARVAALFDLRSTGTPADAALAASFLDAPEDAVVDAALDAVGELCDPALAPRVEAVAAGHEAAKARALARLRACATLSGAL